LADHGLSGAIPQGGAPADTPEPARV
jgi:hypothetical protein